MSSQLNAEAGTAERLARIISLAEKVWENRTDAQAFLNEPHPMLDDSTPLEAAATRVGRSPGRAAAGRVEVQPADLN